MSAITGSAPISEQTAIRFKDKLPETTDVVVIGGGVVGVFCALYLNRQGLRVVLCEKGRIAGEQSSRNWGWIRQHGRDPAELPIMMEANRLWREADKKVGGRTGFQQGGVIYLASSQKELERRAKWLDTAHEHQLDTRMLSKAELDGLVDRSGVGAAGQHEWVGGLTTPSDARGEPWQAVPAVAELASSEGVIIRENCAVRALDIEAGRISGVVTEEAAINAQQVVLAGGAWSSLLLRKHGISIPQLSVRSTAMRTAPLPEFFMGNAADEQISFRRREDGGYTISGKFSHELFIGPDSFRNFFTYLPALREHMLDTKLKFFPPKYFPDSWTVSRNWNADSVSPFEFNRVLEPVPEKGAVARAKNLFSQRFPGIGEPEIIDVWAGMIDAMADIVPIVDRAPSLEGLIIATGMSGHGFGIGPGFGKIIAQMAAGKAVGHDISRFRFSRFSDGSKLRPGPGI